jgi:hypothetical protein
VQAGNIDDHDERRFKLQMPSGSMQLLPFVQWTYKQHKHLFVQLASDFSLLTEFDLFSDGVHAWGLGR